MSTKIFEFLPNGQTLASLKKEARTLHKSGKTKSHTEALNILCSDVCGTSLNKASPNISITSPRIVDNTLLIPIKLDMDVYDRDGEIFNYFVAISNDTIALTSNDKINISDLQLDIHSLQLKNFIKIPVNSKDEAGWVIIFRHYKIIIRTNDEAICCDIYDLRESDEEDAFISLYVFFFEIFIEYLGYDMIENKKLSVHDASIALGHVIPTDSTTLCSFGGIEMILYGHSECNPSLQLATEQGVILGQIFDIIPKTLSEKSMMTSLFFIN